MNKINYAIIAVILAIAVGFYLSHNASAGAKGSPKKAVATSAEPSSEIESATLIQPANFALKDLDGGEVKLSDYEGKVLILDFWATWCPPCRAEIPHFNDLYRDYTEKGFAVLGVSVDRKGADVVRAFMNDNTVGYPVVMFDEATYNAYQSYLPEDERGGIPFTFVIDREGKIRDHFVGYRPKEVFEKAIQPLL